MGTVYLWRQLKVSQLVRYTLGKLYTFFFFSSLAQPFLFSGVTVCLKTVVCILNPIRSQTTLWRWRDGGVGPPCSCPLLSLSDSHLIPSFPLLFILQLQSCAPLLSVSHSAIQSFSLSLSLALFVPETQRWMEKLLEWGAQ